MTDSINRQSYVKVAFVPYITLVVLGTIGLLTALLPPIITTSPNKDLFLAFLSGFFAVAGVLLGWFLAIHRETHKTKEEIQKRKNLIFQEVSDIHEYVLESLPERLNAMGGYSKLAFAPRINTTIFEEHFKHIAHDYEPNTSATLKKLLRSIHEYNFQVKTVNDVNHRYALGPG